MNPVEEYFFDNNIEVWSKKSSGSLTYISTSEGEYILEDNNRLYKVIGNRKEHVILKKEPISSANDTSH